MIASTLILPLFTLASGGFDATMRLASAHLVGGVKLGISDFQVLLARRHSFPLCVREQLPQH